MESYMKGVHYSGDKIEVGQVIRSHQSMGLTYQFVWERYKLVADQHGIFFPKEFGYAYPIDHDKRKIDYVYLVEAPDDRVTRGNYEYSVYHVMATLNQRVGGRGLPLAERLALREKVVHAEAEKYFMIGNNKAYDVKDKIELISDCWVITKASWKK
jgi:hypothetical protein